MTAHTDNQMIQQPSTVVKYVIMFLFCPHSSNTNASVTKTHFAILQEIHCLYPDIQIYNNFVSTINIFKKQKHLML